MSLSVLENGEHHPCDDMKEKIVAMSKKALKESKERLRVPYGPLVDCPYGSRSLQSSLQIYTSYECRWIKPLE